MCQSHYHKAQRNVVRNVSSKPSVCNVKSSDGSPGRVLVSRVHKSACVMVFSSHVYEWPAKLENQRTADAKQSLWEQQFWDIFREGNRNNELYFTLCFIWSSEDTEMTPGRTVSKTFWKRRHLQMIGFIWSCTSCPPGNVSNSWTDILDYNVIILASIHYHHREGGGGSFEVAVWPATLRSIAARSVLLVKNRTVKEMLVSRLD